MQNTPDSFGYENTFRKLPTLSAFKRQIEDPAINHLILGSMPETYEQIAMDIFPFVHLKKHGVNFDYLILTKNEETPIVYQLSIC